jgi:hypothetical protein
MKLTGTVAPADRKLLWWAGFVALLLVGGTIAVSPGADPDTSAVPSTYSSSSGGARAAYLLLLDLGYKVHRWEESPAGLAGLGDKAILILADPTETPSDGEQDLLLRFVQSGGEILFCGAALPKFFPQVKLPARIAGARWIEFSPDLPSPYAHHAGKVIIQPETYWRAQAGRGEFGDQQLTLYGGEFNPVVVVWRVGKGQILWWAGATPLTNSGIPQADNLSLFLNSLSSGTPQGSRAIYWDEYFHGERGSFWSYFAIPPVIWGGFQISVLTLALLFTYSRRSGPIAIPAVVSRLSPLEFVNTMAGLYQRAGAAPVAVGVAYRHLRLELTHRLGLPAAAPDAALAQAAAERLGADAIGLEEAFQKAALAAVSKKMPAREALGLVQSLQRYAVPRVPLANARGSEGAGRGGSPLSRDRKGAITQTKPAQEKI